MSKLSVGKKTVTYAATAALVSALIIIASTLYLGFPAIPQQNSGSLSTSGRTSLAGPRSLLVIQLTDPPHVPSGTSSLNLTYTSIGLLVGEPSGGKVTPTTVTVTPPGGSATLDLLKLQNISQTIASASLPNGSIIYSATLTVSSIAIKVNGTLSQVTLATGGSTFTVVMAQPSALQGTNVALLQLNPVVVGTPSGYQLIPSAVGVVKHSEGQGEEQVGSQHKLTNEDNSDLEDARGNVTANLAALSLSGSITTVTVQVKNTGNATVTLNAIGLHGNFTQTGTGCSSKTSTSTTTTTTTTITTATSTTTTSHGSSSHSETRTSESQHGHNPCELPEHMNEVVFVPVMPAASTATSSTSTTTTSTTSATTSAACTSAQMKLVNGGSEGDSHGRGFELKAGQCVNFTFTGTITFGES
ncbi:MAG: DUF4382 domain-containing protein, partial [Nitrososphaerales archaeon]|nr:DUF4382 domain-containing protein [Nitrososphaerales archaeon]